MVMMLTIPTDTLYTTYGGYAWYVRSVGDVDYGKYGFGDSYGIWCDWTIRFFPKIMVVKIAVHERPRLRRVERKADWRRLRHRRRRRCLQFLRAKFNSLARRTRTTEMRTSCPRPVPSATAAALSRFPAGVRSPVADHDAWRVYPSGDVFSGFDYSSAVYDSYGKLFKYL